MKEKLNMLVRKNLLILACIACIFLLIGIVHADDAVCLTSNDPQPSSPQGKDYDVFHNPVRISSEEAGFKQTACGAATFSAAGERTEPLDTNGKKETRKNIIDACGKAGGLSATNAGTFDDYTEGLIKVLNADPENCFRITIKRINKFTDPAVKKLPAPTKETRWNVEIVTYRPYNFDVADIIDAMKAVKTKGGVGLGAVEYDATNKDTAAHMFQPVSINSKPDLTVPNDPRYAFKIYDPYFNKDLDLEISRDTNEKVYIDLWRTRDGKVRWFHMEELLLTENLGPCPSNWTFINYTSNQSYSVGPRPKVKGPETGGPDNPIKDAPVCRPGNEGVAQCMMVDDKGRSVPMPKDQQECSSGDTKCTKNGVEGTCFTCKCFYCGDGKLSTINNEQCEGEGTYCEVRDSGTGETTIGACSKCKCIGVKVH